MLSSISRASKCSGAPLRINATRRRRTSAIPTSHLRSRTSAPPKIIITKSSSPRLYSSITITAFSPSHRGARRLRTTTLSTRSFSSSTKSSSTKQKKKTTLQDIWNELCKTALQYATIPAVAAFLGLYTNYVGVKMLFYPIEYIGTPYGYHNPTVPYGILGWQGVVPW